MTTVAPGPANKLAELLESAPAEVRQEIVAWLLSGRQPGSPATAPMPAISPHTHPHLSHDPSETARRLTGTLPTGTDSQLVTLRLPADRHAALRDWCNGHGFSMAAVVRGLVERFLEEQARTSQP